MEIYCIMEWRLQKLFDWCEIDIGWVEKKMLLKFPENKWLSARLESVIQAGFMSHLIRIVIEYENTQENYKAIAPNTILIKVPNYKNASMALKSAELIEDKYAVSQGIGIIKLLSETEGRFYSLVNDKNHNLKIPKIFYLNLDNSNNEIQCIIMEEVLDVYTIDIVEGLNKTQLYNLVDFIIELHLLSFMENLDNPGSSYEEWNKLPLSFNDYVLNARKRYMNEYPDSLGPLIEKTFNKYLKVDNIDEIKYKCLEDKPNMCFLSHGDLWTSNILFDAKDKNNLRCVVDWQLALKTSPFEDLTHLLFSCISPELRRECQNDVFKYYYKNLKNSVEKQGKSLSFNYQDLTKMFYEMLPYLVNRNLFAISMWTASSLCKTGKNDEEERIFKLNSRLKALFEDIETNNLMK
ncbi:Protein kinase-like domain and Uncharacterised oxidoreductase Dhs-27 family and CHK kinase-like domain-containing protein [Strongyloides ratti]|uniref:Protein kinase-like domain and Uncharacterized oxidoreductase Dhs-27 family and CHK kinase-like domain-containing protein n=1 Tax=Strongyloides ratti TaxID=34506 RepID=A0A090KU09_STRRB|nr:Protein kinase-like domain and Uncharacterised oxidoreductase Dhs-27 family and CHK kinase-like domain-containing protein [Strongyloides ratti]CEF61005.1 Protein kinase-like domain and Uncharacterised oxidoreductase Dhs-27 family and CHK kinase-like domain-containing protein [Strongyloides ratti]